MYNEKETNRIVAENIKRYLNQYEMSQADLAKRLDVSPQSVSNWCKGTKSPRMDKVDAMCSIFHCRRSDLLEQYYQIEEDYSYYYDEAVREMVDFMHKNPEYQTLFDASRRLKKEDLKFVIDLIERMS